MNRLLRLTILFVGRHSFRSGPRTQPEAKISAKKIIRFIKIAFSKNRTMRLASLDGIPRLHGGTEEMGRSHSSRRSRCDKKTAIWPEPYLILGLAQMQQKNYERAVEHFDQTIALKSNQPLAYFQMGMAYLYLNEPLKASQK